MAVNLSAPDPAMLLPVKLAGVVKVVVMVLVWPGVSVPRAQGKAVVQAHQHEAKYVDRPEALLADVDTPEDFAAVMKNSLADDRPSG